MTREQMYDTYDEELHSNSKDFDNEAILIPDKTSVKDMILRFERTAASSPDGNEEYVEKRKKMFVGNFIHPHYNQTVQDRNSSVSINSILSGVSEGSLESNSSGFVSDRKSGTEFNHPLVPHRPAPPPPEPFNDSSSSTSRSPVPGDITYIHDKRFSLPSPTQSPVVLRRARQPPCIRRKSLISNQVYQGESHWSYGVKQSDLEILLRLKRSESSDNENDNSNTNKIEELQKDQDCSDESGSSENEDGSVKLDNCSVTDDMRIETVSIDQSTDTLKNEDDEVSDIDENFFGSEGSGNPSNYDNVSIKSISSFENIVPYDSVTVSSDEFGSEVCNDPDSDFLTVSAVNEWCVAKSKETVLIPVETKKEKYRRRLRERVNELVHTETVYVDRLRHVVDDYVSKMNVPDQPVALRGLKPEIFSNIDKIYKFHSEEFLPALKDCENDLRKLGQCFRRFEQKFNMYVMYSRNNKRATRLVFEHKAFFQVIQHELGDRLDLSSYLLEPVQRIPRYKLFLDDLVKTYINYENEKSESDSRISELSGDSDDTGGSNGESSDSDETPLESLKLAKAMVEYVLTAIDGIMALENIRDSPINLLHQGRLLRQSEFTVMDNTRKRRQLMRVFLFDKVVLLTAVYKKQLTVELFLYRDHIPVDDMGITAKEHDKYKFTIWYKNRNSKSYKLETREAGVRDTWVEDIRSLLWEQANLTKELLLRSRVTRKSVVSMNSEDSEQNSDKYNSLRGVPGEVRRSIETIVRRTTWYCE